MRGGGFKIFYLLLVGLLLLPSCTFLSDRNYVQQYPEFQGIRRVAVLIQRWPVYLQLPNQDDPGADFIKKSTLFTGPWQPAGLINPRAVDIQDIQDEAMAELLMQDLTGKGYQPYLSGVLPPQPGSITVAEIMAKGQAVDGGVDAFLFCFYSPTVFFAEAQSTPKEHRTRSYNILELMGTLSPGADRVIWAGPRAAKAPPNSISHAFIYVSMTMFKAGEGRTLWQVAGSQAGGRFRPWIPQCPPGPTDQDYWADPRIIQALMVNNLKCRLQHLIPNAF